jgi:hypothetical protein
MAQQNILPGNAPIVWSTVDSAFQRINANFTELYLSIGGDGVDLSNIAASLIPDTDSVRDLGSSSRRWRDIYLSGSSIYLGPAIITSNLSGHVNLPSGSTVGGELIRNPGESSFKTIRISGQSDVVANDFEGVLNFSGAGISITSTASTDSITFTNDGVTSLSAAVGSGITLDRSSGAVTISSTGIQSITASGSGILIGGTTTDPVISNTGVTQLTAGAGISLNNTSGSITVTNSAPNIIQNVFRFISVAGSATLDPASSTSTLNINSFNSGLSIASNDLTNTITFTNTGVTGISVDDAFNISGGTGAVSIGLKSIIQRNIEGDVKGSVFGDDSTKIVDAVEGKVYGGIFATTLRTDETEIRLGVMPDFTNPVGGPAAYTVALGAFAGEIRQNTNAIAIGYIAANEDQGDHAIAVGVNSGGQRQGSYGAAFGVEAGYRDQGVRALALGYQAGAFSQGVEAVAIGKGAGHTNQHANSLILNATGVNLNSDGTSRFYVAPIRNQTGTSGVVQYDATTKEVSYSSSIAGTFTGNVFTTLIDSADSSAITVTPAVIFNADINIENDIQLSNIHAAIRGTDKIKFVPNNADELSYNVRLDVYSESTIEPRLALDTPDGVDLTLSSGMAGIVVSKIHGRVNLAAGNNAFIVRENGSWAMTPLDAEPTSATVGIYIANGGSWNPAAKPGGRPYPVWYDGVSYNALY